MMDLIDDLMKELSIDFAELLKRYEQGMVELKIHEINEYSNNRLIHYIRVCNIFCHACNNTKKYAFCKLSGDLRLWDGPWRPKTMFLITSVRVFGPFGDAAK